MCLWHKRDEEGGLDNLSKLKRKQLFADLEIVNSRSEAIQKQTSRSCWLGVGDMNTKFFHMTTRCRSIQNMIKGYKIQNEWCKDPVLVKNQVKEFFQNRFVESDDVKIRLDNTTFPSLNES